MTADPLSMINVRTGLSEASFELRNSVTERNFNASTKDYLFHDSFVKQEKDFIRNKSFNFKRN